MSQAFAPTPGGAIGAGASRKELLSRAQFAPGSVPASGAAEGAAQPSEEWDEAAASAAPEVVA
eukprot:4127677-Prymnesium_polylepis.1